MRRYECGWDSATRHDPGSACAAEDQTRPNFDKSENDRI